MFSQPTQPTAFYSQAPQVQRHEIARIRQLIHDLENHHANLFNQLSILATEVDTPEDQLRYAGLVQKIRETRKSLMDHSKYLEELLTIAPTDFSRNISDQVKREIFHLYSAGRYTQDELANQYAVSQSTVHRIVTGEAPLQLTGVNLGSLTK